MIRTGEVIPGVPDNIHRAVAEILACVDLDPEIRRDHRRDKLESFPEDLRPAIRDAANKVISARSKTNPIKETPGSFDDFKAAAERLRS